MFCSQCGNILEEDAFFCTVCGRKVKRAPADNAFAPERNIPPETETDIQTATLYTPENNSQPEFAPENSASEEKELEKFFGSTEPIQHINPEPVTAQTEEIEQMKKVMENHTREPLPDLVLRKKAEAKKENPPEKIYQPEEEYYDDEEEEEYYSETPESYDDNSETQYINLKNKYNYRNNYEQNYSGEEYYDEPEYDDYPPEDEYIPAYNPPQRERNQLYRPPVQEYRTVHVGTARLVSAGVVTFITMLIFVALSLIFCIKLGFSGNAVEKGINRLDMEKVLDAEYDGNRDFNKFLYDKSGFYNISYQTAGENDFRNFVLSLDIPDFMGENAGIYADYFLNNGKKPTLTSGDIATYMSARAGFIGLGWNEFSNMLYNLTDNKIDSILSVDSWEADTGFDFRLLSYMSSATTLVILLAVVCVFMIWIAVIVDKRGKYLAGFYKNIFMTSGVILLIAGAVCFIAPPVVYSQTNHVLFYIISKIMTDFNLFIFATGAFELIVGIILGLIRSLIVRHERIYGDG